MNIKIGIVGSRRRNTDEDKQKVRETLLTFLSTYPYLGITLISGGCPLGADRFAEELAEELNIPITIHYPNKSNLKSNSKWAWAEINYARNTLIAQDSDILIACVAEDRKGGTEDTIKKFQKMGKPGLILI